MNLDGPGGGADPEGEDSTGAGSRDSQPDSGIHCEGTFLRGAANGDGDNGSISSSSSTGGDSTTGPSLIGGREEFGEGPGAHLLQTRLADEFLARLGVVAHGQQQGVIDGGRQTGSAGGRNIFSAHHPDPTSFSTTGGRRRRSGNNNHNSEGNSVGVQRVSEINMDNFNLHIYFIIIYLYFLIFQVNR
jgi:hypothetical protein